MSLANWVCIFLIVIGIVVFLYGANSYTSTVGWAGLYVLILGAVTLLALYLYGELTKKPTQNP
jgi:membrane-bound ClpP family serine protease